VKNDHTYVKSTADELNLSA